MTEVICFECGSSGFLHKHHVIPRSLGGTKTILLCTRCHGKVHSREFCTSALTKKAMAVKKANGQRVGTVPYGFDLSDDGVTLVANESEQAVIRDIQTMRADGMSLEKIADTLTYLGIPTKTGKSSRWTHQAVNKISKREETWN